MFEGVIADLIAITSSNLKRLLYDQISIQLELWLDQLDINPTTIYFRAIRYVNGWCMPYFKLINLKLKSIRNLSVNGPKELQKFLGVFPRFDKNSSKCFIIKIYSECQSMIQNADVEFSNSPFLSLLNLLLWIVDFITSH